MPQHSATTAVMSENVSSTHKNTPEMHRFRPEPVEPQQQDAITFAEDANLINKTRLVPFFHLSKMFHPQDK